MSKTKVKKKIIYPEVKLKDVLGAFWSEA